MQTNLGETVLVQLPDKAGEVGVTERLRSDGRDEQGRASGKDKTYKILVVKSFMSHTTNVVPPLDQPTGPLLFLPLALTLPNVACSSSNILYNFLMNSLGPDWPPPPVPDPGAS